MSAKAISEQTGKELLYKFICTTSAIQNRFKYARVTPDTDWARLLQDHPWLLTQVSLSLLDPSSRPSSRESSQFERKQSLLLHLLFPCSKYKLLSFQSLVVKPDQLIKRRGKLGLVGVNLTLDGVKSWLKPRLGQETTVSLGIGLGWPCCGCRSKHGHSRLVTV